MGLIKEPKPVKVFCAILFREENILNIGLQKLEDFFGKVDIKSEIFHFDVFTDYYKVEMGENLKKVFVSFKKILSPENCFKWKLFSNEIEKQHSLTSEKPSRMINIDPGYLDLSRVVLLTTKDYSHRIYLGKGIYAEITLLWKHGKFEHLAWTYPDYKTEISIKFFERLREALKKEISLKT
ncbi:MAG: DUF4416 family protein [Candidatus Omnitrophica bacterium]|nr:DUF4416 family protein [Candidatus Omnitrophota bacterium]